jgi:light-regulated signal transduction histidine kinase (bacteriophytochrome)
LPLLTVCLEAYVFYKILLKEHSTCLVIIRNKNFLLAELLQPNSFLMSVENFEKIFQPFHVADLPASARFQSEFERTGLGLAITKEYVNLHDDSIWVESRVGEGTTFHVVLPIDHS